MAYSKVVIPGDGVTKIFAVNFAMDYLLEADVTCRVDGEVDGSGELAYRDITFISTNVLEIAGTAAGVGVDVIFERTVDKELLRVDYTNGDVMDEANLDTSQRQLMMAVHELLDGRVGIQSQDFNVGGYKIVNLGAPTAASHATTKSYVDGIGNTVAAANEVLRALMVSQATAIKNEAIAATGVDKAATAADRVQTGLDRVATGADVITTANTAASAAALFDLFDDRWLGSKASNPTLDNDGNALLVGAVYWNSVGNELRVYSGSVWVAYSPAIGMLTLEDDDAPKLGGDLDLNGHTITGLQNVNNTSDANKPVSTATQTALDAKSDKIRTLTGLIANYTLQASDNNKVLIFANTSDIVITVPFGLPQGMQVDWISRSLSAVSFDDGANVTLESEGSQRKARAYASAGSLVKTYDNVSGTDYWLLSGSIKP